MAYAAPNEDTVVVVGGLGTQVNKAQLNGGGATKAVWDAGSPSDFINTNGGPKRTASCAFTTASKNLNGTDIGNGITVGTLCYVSTGDGTHIDPGVYEITTVTDNDNIICAQIGDDGTNDTGVTVNVGGALDGLQNALDNDINDASSYNRYIYDNIATETITATIDLDTNAGAANSHIIIIGYNSTLAAEAEVIITTTTDLSGNGSGLLSFNAKSYYEFRKIDFYGGGKDASRAVYCVMDVAAAQSEHVLFTYCKFRGASSHGVNQSGSRHFTFIDCEFNLNGGNGYEAAIGKGYYLKILACSVHDNDAHGINIQSLCLATGCLLYDNGKDGSGNGLTTSSVSDYTVIINNTAYGNADDGFQIDDLSDNCVIASNAAIGNGAYGFDLQGKSIQPTGFFGYNLAGANTTAHYSEGADNTFADFRHGNNVASSQTADQLLKTITDGSEDFTPETGSDLIDNALDAGTA